jgi:pimeloyl-ACP methyl ester carboxylesterase
VRLAAERPPGLAGLVLAATYLRRPLQPLLRPLVEVLRAALGPRLFAVGLRPAVVHLLMAGLDAPRPLAAEVCAAVRALRPEVTACRAADALTLDARPELARVEVPILLLAPARDRLVHAGGVEDVLSVRPEAEVVRLDGPHMIFQRAPHACLLAMEGFAARVLAAPPARRTQRRRAPARAGRR